MVIYGRRLCPTRVCGALAMTAAGGRGRACGPLLGDPRAGDPHGADVADRSNVDGRLAVDQQQVGAPPGGDDTAIVQAEGPGRQRGGRPDCLGRGQTGVDQQSQFVCQRGAVPGTERGAGLVIGVGTGDDGQPGCAGGGDGAAGVCVLHRWGHPQPAQQAEHQLAADGRADSLASS